MLDAFALVVLFVVVAAAIGGAVLLGAMPGRIARARNHPQADAIAVCGWWGLITFGLLLPLAYVWAYTDSSKPLFGASRSSSEAGVDSRSETNR